MCFRLKYHAHLARCFQGMISPLLYPYTRGFTSCFHNHNFRFITLLIIKPFNSRTINTHHYFGCISMVMNSRLSSWQQNIKHTLTILVFRVTQVVVYT